MDIKDILQAAAVYNKVNSGSKDFVPVKVWTTIQLDTLKEQAITELINIMHQANANMFFGTATKIVLTHDGLLPDLNSTELRKIVSSNIFVIEEEKLKYAEENISIVLDIRAKTCSDILEFPLEQVDILYIQATEYPTNLAELLYCQQTAQLLKKHIRKLKIGVGFSNVFAPNRFFPFITYNIYKERLELYINEVGPPLEWYVEPMRGLIDTPVALNYISRFSTKLQANSLCNLTEEVKTMLHANTKINSERLNFIIYYDSRVFKYSETMVSNVVKSTKHVLLKNYHPLRTEHNVFLENLLDLFVTVTKNSMIENNVSVVPCVLIIKIQNSEYTWERISAKFRVGFVDFVYKLASTINAVIPGLVSGILFDSTRNFNETFQRLRNSINSTNGPRLGTEVNFRFKTPRIYDESSCNYEKIPPMSEILLIGRDRRSLIPISECTGLQTQTRIYNREHFGCFNEMSMLKKKLPNLEIMHYERLTGCWGNATWDSETDYLIHLKALSDLSYTYSSIIFAGLFFQPGLRVEMEYANGVSTAPLKKQAEISATLSFRSCGFTRVEINKTFSGEYILIDKPSFVKGYLDGFHDTKTPIHKTLNHNPWWTWTLSLLGIILITTLLLLAYKIIKSRLLGKIVLQDLAELLSNDRVAPHAKNIAGIEEALASKYNTDKYEISKSQFSIAENICLGSGEYGVVLKGTITQLKKDVPVAIKTIKRSSKTLGVNNILQLKSLVSEIKILSYIGNHPNIVKFFGANTSELPAGRLCIFLEFCKHGSLLKYLRDLTVKVEDAVSDNTQVSNLQYENIQLQTQQPSEETLDDMCRWSREIANGMEFIASKRLIHGDLAARNVLLNSEKTAKISDFGLSRRLYEREQYVKTSQEPLPWRWMPPEALRKMEFNEKSDVWSYGVILWEIFTLGDTPYPGLAYDADFATCLAEGLNPREPTYGEEHLYSIMTRCWQVPLDRRPTFSDIVLFFASE